jgi:hypothetical protein
LDAFITGLTGASTEGDTGTTGRWGCATGAGASEEMNGMLLQPDNASVAVSIAATVKPERQAIVDLTARVAASARERCDTYCRKK